MLAVLAYVLATKRPPPYFKKPARRARSRSAVAPPPRHAARALTRPRARRPSAQYNPVQGETHFLVADAAWLLVEQARAAAASTTRNYATSAHRTRARRCRTTRR